MRRAVAVVAACAMAFAGVVAVPGAATALDAGPWIHNPTTGHDYQQVVPMTWWNAEAYAVSVGGHLVTVNDAAEESWLASTFPMAQLWIGFNDYANERTWVWASGEPVTYTNWLPGEPNNYTGVDARGEDYAVMNYTGSSGNIGWNDLPDTVGERGAIIEVVDARFHVGVDFDGIGGDGWPAGVDLTVTADDPETGQNPDIGPFTLPTDAEGKFSGSGVLPGVEPGWYVTVTDGVTTKTHTVTNVSITDVDPATEIVRGTAEPFGTVWCNPTDYGDTAGHLVEASAGGQWLVDFSGDYDIRPGSEVNVLEIDEDDDSTFVYWVVSDPLVAILLGDIETALVNHDLEGILEAWSLALAGLLSSADSKLVLDAAQKATNVLVTGDLKEAIDSKNPQKLLESVGLCMSGIVTFGPEPDHVPQALYDEAMKLIRQLVDGATLSVSVLSPVDVCVTDPLGRRAGTLEGETFDEIPGAYYTGPDTTPEHVQVPLTEVGTYKIDLTATGEGPYHLVIAGLGLPDGERVNTYEGTAEPGAAYSYEFELAAPDVQIEDILAFFDASVADGTLTGTGPRKSASGRLGALRNMVELAGDYIRAGQTADALAQLRDVYSRCDGMPKPPDFVAGPARQELAAKVMLLIIQLGG